MLKDKVVVITGAGSGVGRAAVMLFAQNGAKVISADLNADWAENAAAAARDAGAAAVAIRCDVRARAEVDAAVALAVSTFGRLDVMYNNAGVASTPNGGPATFLEQNDDDFERLVSINYRGVVYGCQAAARQFKAQGGGGVIVNTSSVAGIVGWGGVMYGSTKGAVNQLTRGLAIEFAKDGIRVNTVCPGGMFTNFGRAEGKGFEPPSKEALDRYANFYPLGLPISAEDTANAALFLASDMARNITGVLLPVDGGYVAA